MTNDVPDRIHTRTNYDGTWDGEWVRDGEEPPEFHAYHSHIYLRATPPREHAEELVEALRDVLRHMPDYADTSWVDAAALLARIEQEKP